MEESIEVSCMVTKITFNGDDTWRLIALLRDVANGNTPIEREYQTWARGILNEIKEAAF